VDSSGAGPRSALAAFGLPLEAARLLWRERGLLRLAWLPALLSVLAVTAALMGVALHASELLALSSAFLPDVEAGAWWSWLWVGPLRVLLWVVARLLLLAFAAACVVAALLLASLAAAPVHEALSRRVERTVTGGVREQEAEGLVAALRQGGRAVREELRRVIFFISVSGALTVFGLLVPGAQLVVAPALAVFGVLFLALEYASFVLDRRGLSFREKRRWLRRHGPATLAFGSAAFLACAVPVLNFVAMPVLVVAGTLLVLRNPPDAPEPTSDGAPGSPTSP
jgi:CysZ protein